MVRKRWSISILLLFVAALACVPLPDFPKNNQSDAARKAGECSDPRFKEAELAAYQVLLQARTDAANRLTRQINNIEAERKKLLSKLSDDYQSDLKKCGDAGCTLAAKGKYDQAVAGGQRNYDQVLQLVQEQEQRAIEAAQAMYNKAVEKAKQQFCGTPTPTSTETPTPTPTATATPDIFSLPTPSS